MMNSFVRSFFSALYPSCCIMCRVVVAPCWELCDQCRFMILSIPVLRHPLKEGHTLVVNAVSSYEPPLSHLIRAKEYRARSAAVQLGNLLSQHIREKMLRFDLLIPVPQHWTRYAWRGYNQADVIAQHIARDTGTSIVQPFARVRKTKLQKMLSITQRQENVTRAFGLARGWSFKQVVAVVQNMHVLLVDDVYTTGATLSELARLAWRFAPRSVQAAVVCRVTNQYRMV